MGEMIKTAEIKPGLTPDTERRTSGQKTASTEARTRALDNDITKRLADRAAKAPR